MKKLSITRLNEEHFERDDGSRFAKIYSQPIYFHNKGKLQHLDEYKLELLNGEITNSSDEFNVKIKGRKISYKTDKNTVHFEIDGLFVDDVLIAAPHSVEPTFTDNEVIWADIFDGVDIKLSITPYRVQEYIILKQNPLLGKPFDGDNLYVKFKETGNHKGLITKEPFATDNKGKYVPTFVQSDKKGLPVRALYTYSYPITIDPTVSPNPSSDAYVYYNGETATYTRTDDATIRVYTSHYDNGCGVTYDSKKRGYMRFDISSMSSYTINSASLNIYVETCPQQFYVNQSAGEVDPETGAVATVYANALGTHLAIIGYTGNQVITATDYVNTHKGGFCDFGLTDAVNIASNDTIISSSESTTNKPYLLVDYTSGSSPVNVSITQTANTMAVTTGTQTVSANQVNSVAITQVSKAVNLTTGTQSVATSAVVNASITQVSTNLAIAVGTQVVNAVRVVSSAISQVACSLSLSLGTATVVTVIIASASISQTGVVMAMSGGTQDIASSMVATVSQVNTPLAITPNTQEVASIQLSNILQITKSVSLNAGNQAVATVNNVSISQDTGNLLLVGGNQSIGNQNEIDIAQTSTNIQVTTGNQSVVANAVSSALIQQVSKQIVITPNTQVVNSIRIVGLNQTSKSIALSSGTQDVSANRNVLITQQAKSVTIAGGVQTVIAQPFVNCNILVPQSHLLLSSGIQSVVGIEKIVNTSILQTSCNISVITGIQILSTSTGPLPSSSLPKYILVDGDRAKHIFGNYYIKL